jgi:hypothetical protein
LSDLGQGHLCTPLSFERLDLEEEQSSMMEGFHQKERQDLYVIGYVLQSIKDEGATDFSQRNSSGVLNAT